MPKKSVNIPEELFNHFKFYSSKTGASFTNVVIIALKEFLDRKNY